MSAIDHSILLPASSGPLFAVNGWRERLRRQWAMRVEAVAALCALYFAVACNASFWGAALEGHDLGSVHGWIYAAALLTLLSAIHLLPLLLILTQRTAKPVLVVLVLATACAAHFVQTFGIYLDPSMLRNALRTDVHEAGELLNPGFALDVIAYALLPLLFLARVRLVKQSWRPALLGRAVALLLVAFVAGLSLAVVFQDLASLFRNHKEVRYLITPGNYLYSLVRVGSADARSAEQPRQPVGRDAVLGASWQARSKPALFVLVVGETARAANWGLSGYARQTTPELAKRDAINFPRVTACGTNTEVSVPCMFSAVGRRAYDEDRIRNSESLLHVLDHAGLKVLWRDNQSGCKGVCSGLEEQRLASAAVPGLCDGERCLDEVLLHGLDQVLEDSAGNRVIVMHQLGNHGPAYHKRYPAEFGRFQPACGNADLAKCSREEIVNAYDNALLYTDAVLAKTIDFLRTQEARYDTAMLYVSDHGESLGENRLFLHGMPYAIAPGVQTEVPMIAWLSGGFARSAGVDMACLNARAAQPVAHDHLFHTVLGLLDVQTSVYESAWDFSAECRHVAKHA